MDKWDYFARDCHYMGILTEFDWRYSIFNTHNVTAIYRHSSKLVFDNKQAFDGCKPCH